MASKQCIDNVIESLERVSQETKEMIFEMAKGMTEMEIIHSFNQKALDLFTLLITITTRMGKENEYKVGGYKKLFDSAIKINTKLPIDKFTLIILEFAAEIYAGKENCFLEMSIPDTNVNVGNEFSIIRSEMFKKLWVVLDDNDKNILKDNIILLTTFAHVHLYKTLLSKKK